MNTPTQEQFQVVIDTLEKANEMRKVCFVDMGETEANTCGTPMCHGGWYATALGLRSYTPGANRMADDLGFDNQDDLCEWAELNPEIWGNDNGEYMFCDGSAFNQRTDDGFTLQTIIDHWKGVKQRAAELTKQN